MNRKPGAAVAGMTLVLLTAVLVSLSMGSVRVPVLSVLGQALGLCAQRTGEYATQAYILAQVRLDKGVKAGATPGVKLFQALHKGDDAVLKGVLELVVMDP